MPLDQYLLSDQDVLHFITHGYHIVSTPDIPAVHESVCAQTLRVFQDGNPRDAIWEKIPHLHDVFNHPAVRGALTSLLGEEYAMYSHRHCHLNLSGSDEGRYHQDGTERAFSGWHRPWRRHFRDRTIMAMYYPHDVTEEEGPTAIVPGSQYYHTLSEEEKKREMGFCGKAGDIILVHFDIWHRATANRSDRERIMMKFLFKRTAEPMKPSWQAKSNFKPAFSVKGALPELPLIWEDMWRWHLGEAWPVNQEYSDVDDLIEQMIDELASPTAAHVINTAYMLGRLGLDAIPGLIDALDSAPDEVRERVPIALSAGGEASVESLTHGLLHPDPWIRATAADTIGDIGLPALDALPGVLDALHDYDPWVRHNAAETLGVWGRMALSAQDQLVEALHDDEPFVRFNAATALSQMDLQAVVGSENFQSLLKDDHDMVRHHARELAIRAA